MRQILVCVCLLTMQIIANAQDIDASWYYRPGVHFTQVHTFDPDQSKFDVSTFGTDQVWDFSYERFNSLVDTTWFLEPSEMVFADNYPNATVGRRNVSPFFDWEWYYRLENDTLYCEGESFIRTIGSPDTVILTLENLDILHMTPNLSLEDKFVDSEAIPVTEVTFQGYGTVITRVRDTFPNCILLKREFLNDSSVEYRWYQTDLTREIAVFSNDGPNPALTRIKDYVDINSVAVLDTKESDNTLSYYIHQGQLSVNNTGGQSSYRVQVYDISGRQLHNSSQLIQTGDNLLPIRFDSDALTLVVWSIDEKSGSFQFQKISHVGW